MKLSEIQQQSRPMKLSEVQALTAAPDADQASVSGAARFARGVTDIPQATGQMVLHALPEAVVRGLKEAAPLAAGIPVVGPALQAARLLPNKTAAEYDQQLSGEEAAYQASRQAAGQEGVDWARLGGNIVGTAPAALAMPVSGGGLLAKTGMAAAQGGAMGLSQPTYDAENFALEKAKQAGVGATVGAVFTPVVAGLARMVNPKVTPDIKTLMNEGITPTPGQIMGGNWRAAEEKLTSVPLLGDAIKSGQRRAINQFNQAAYRRALDPIGKGTPEIGRGGITAVKKALGDAYDELLPKISFKADQQFVGDVARLQAMAKNLPAPQAAQFDKILENKLVARMTSQGGMTGETMKGVESELTRIAKGYKGDASFDNRELGDAIGEVLASLRRTTIRSNPQHAKELQAINLGYANYARLRQAASSLGAEGGVFTPAQLQNAVKSGDKSVGKGSFAAGSALMQDLSEAGKNTLSSKYPDSGTAGRLMMDAGAAAAVGTGAMLSPAILKGAALTAIPALGYTPWGQKALASLLTQRPQAAQPAANALMKMAPAISAGGAAAVTSNTQ
jgi:hypothetical protein